VRRLRSVFALLLAGVVMSGLAACGSSDSGGGASATDDGGGGGGGSTAAATTATSGGAAPTGAAIKIGTICTCSGPVGAGLAGVKPMMQAWVKWTNAHGGLNGHPVELTILDDKGDATASATLARQLINDKVMAIVGHYTLQSNAWADIVQKAGVPVVGTPGVNRPEFTNPDFYPTGGGPPMTLTGNLNNAGLVKAPNVAVMYCTEAPVCAQVKQVAGKIAGIVGNGVKIAASPSISGSQPSYATQCLAAKSSGADSAIILESQNITSRVIQQCIQQGWKPVQLSSGGSLPHDDPSAFGKSKAVLTNPTLSIDDPGATMQTFRAMLKQYAPSVASGKDYSEVLSAPYAGLQLFAKVADTAKLTPTSTPDDVKKGLYALKDETLGGLTVPLNYKEGQPTFLSCYFRTQYDGSKWVSTPKPICLTAAQTSAVKAAFGLS